MRHTLWWVCIRQCEVDRLATEKQNRLWNRHISIVPPIFIFVGKCLERKIFEIFNKLKMNDGIEEINKYFDLTFFFQIIKDFKSFTFYTISNVDKNWRHN